MQAAGGPVELLLGAAERFTGVGPVVELEASRVLLVGDTHGYPEVSTWALGLAERLGVDWKVFIGDYVDRGPRGVENLEMLVERSLQDERLLLLRGNHESLLMNSYYGFAEEAIAKRGRDYLRVAERLYRSLPLVAIINGSVMVVHGGIPCRRCRSEPEEPYRIGEIRGSLEGSWDTPEMDDPSNPVAMQLLWNDPRGSIDWFLPSPRGPGTYLYGRRAWTGFLEANRLSFIVRGHERSDAAHLWRRDGRRETFPRGGSVWRLSLDELGGGVVTVFSSLYHGMGAGALLLDLEEGVATVYRYPYTPGGEEDGGAG